MPSEWEKEMARLKWWLSEDYQRNGQVVSPGTGGRPSPVGEDDRAEAVKKEKPNGDAEQNK